MKIIVGLPDEKSLDLYDAEKILSERRGLIDILKNNNIDVEVSKSRWPRNDFTNYRGITYYEKDYGHYADGGYVLVRDDFTLICSDVNKRLDGTFEDIDGRTKKLFDMYGKNIFLIPSPDVKRNRYMSPHIDMVVLPVPSRGLLLADKLYYSKNRETLERFSKKYNLEVSIVQNNDNDPTWPCNSLVVGDKIFTSEKNLNLEEYGLKTIHVPFKENNKIGGSIHCATNEVY